MTIPLAVLLWTSASDYLHRPTYGSPAWQRRKARYWYAWSRSTPANLQQTLRLL